MKRRLLYAVLGIVIVVIACGTWVNSRVARDSVPYAVYMTLVPMPFQFEASYHSGKVQGVVIGDEWRKATGYLLSQSSCLVLRGKELVGKEQLHVIDKDIIDRNGRILVRCHDAGVAWNMGLIVSGEKIVEVRLSGGMWTD